MNNIFFKKSILAIAFVFFSFAIEGVLFEYIGFGLFPKYIILNLVFDIFIATILFLIPWHLASVITSCVILLLQIALSYTNVCIMKSLDQIFTWDMLEVLNETKDAASMAEFPVLPLVALIAVYLVFVAITVATCFIKIKKEKKEKKKFYSFVTNFIVLGTFTLCSVMNVVQVKTFDKGEEGLYQLSDEYLFSTFSSPKSSLKNFGTWGYYANGLLRYLFPTKTHINASAVTDYAPQDSALFGLCRGDNVITICAESFDMYAISKDITPTLYALSTGMDLTTIGVDNFYSFGTDSSGFTTMQRKDYDYNADSAVKYTYNGTNIYSGIATGKYGLTLNSFYGNTKTEVAEFSGILGNYPYLTTFTSNYKSTKKYKNFDFSFSLPNMLKSNLMVQETNYLHTYYGSFYGRNEYMGNFGFDNIVFGDELPDILNWEKTLTLPVFDSQVLDYYLNMSDSFNFISSNKSFYSHFMTVTTHGDYIENERLNPYYEFVDSLNPKAYSTKNNAGYFLTGDSYIDSSVRTYFAKVLDTERMMTILVKYLQENNLLEKTTIVFYADHYAYKSSMLDYKKMYMNYTSDDDILQYKIPAFIYSSKIDSIYLASKGYSRDISHLTWVYDIVPTILTLQGINYSTFCYLGYPVICVDSAGEEIYSKCYISTAHGYFNEKIYSIDGTAVTYCVDQDNVEQLMDELIKDVSETINKWQFINNLYQDNSFGRYVS